MTYTQDLQATIEAIGREYPRIAAWFRTFSGADWERPTFCPGWSAAKAAGHLAFGAEFFAEAITNGLKGYVGLPYGAGSREEFMQIRDAKAEEIGRLSGAALVDRFESNMAAVLGLFQSLRPEDYERPAWHRRSVFPIRRFIFSRLNELLLHEWDIRNRPEAPLDPPSVAVAGANLRQHFQLFYEMDPVAGLAGTFGFALTDTGHRWAMRVSDKKAEDLGLGQHRADVTFSATAGDMVLLSSGRGSLDQRQREGRFRAEGDAAKAGAIMPKLFFPL
ncbi:MAG: maleylpyruvate isomerase family mycothiol-dependent enzyme [Nitrospinota bacterium]